MTGVESPTQNVGTISGKVGIILKWMCRNVEIYILRVDILKCHQSDLQWRTPRAPLFVQVRWWNSHLAYRQDSTKPKVTHSGGTYFISVQAIYRFYGVQTRRVALKFLNICGPLMLASIHNWGSGKGSPCTHIYTHSINTCYLGMSVVIIRVAVVVAAK